MFKKIEFSFHNFQDRHLPRIFSYCHITGSSQWANRQDYSAGIPKGLIFYFIIPHKIELLLAGNNSCRCFFCKITENFPKYPLKGTKARKQRFQFIYFSSAYLIFSPMVAKASRRTTWARSRREWFWTTMQLCPERWLSSRTM